MLTQHSPMEAAGDQMVIKPTTTCGMMMWHNGTWIARCQMDCDRRPKVLHHHPAPSCRCYHRFDPQWGVHSTVLVQNVDFSLKFASKVHLLHENDHERMSNGLLYALMCYTTISHLVVGVITETIPSGALCWPKIPIFHLNLLLKCIFCMKWPQKGVKWIAIYVLMCYITIPHLVVGVVTDLIPSGASIRLCWPKIPIFT